MDRCWAQPPYAGFGSAGLAERRPDVRGAGQKGPRARVPALLPDLSVSVRPRSVVYPNAELGGRNRRPDSPTGRLKVRKLVEHISEA